ncbi:glycosyltransferase, partial [Escherichia coli]|nr:glycosyltransferase [Escherichia coli]
IIDDGSTDNTAHEISNFTDLRITYVMLPINSGVANARNIGIKMAKGKFIAFLDSDDIWEKEKLSLQIPLLEKGYDVV